MSQAPDTASDQPVRPQGWSIIGTALVGFVLYVFRPLATPLTNAGLIVGVGALAAVVTNELEYQMLRRQASTDRATGTGDQRDLAETVADLQEEIADLQLQIEALEAEEPDSTPGESTGEIETTGSGGETTDRSPDRENRSEPIQADDFVRMEYTIRTADSGEIVDTTREQVAKEVGIDTDEYDFSPQVIVVGAGHVYRPVEEDIIGRQVGETQTVTVPAREAYGEHDPEMVETIDVSRIPEEGRHPGAQVEINNDQATVETVVDDRARVDFNHPFAGEDLKYEYKILERITDRVEKAESLLDLYLGPIDDVGIRIEANRVDDGKPDEQGQESATRDDTEETLYIELPSEIQLNQQWMFQKQRIGQELRSYLGVDSVVVEEPLDEPSGIGGMGGMGGFSAEDIDAEDMAELIADTVIDLEMGELQESLDDADAGEGS